MTDDERKRVGRRLRALRAERGLTQVQVATDRRVDIAIGTLQSIESGQRENRESKIEKLAKFYGTSLAQLRTQHDQVRASDPRLEKLTDEDLRVARLYHDASTAVRQRALAVLRFGEGELATKLAERLSALPADSLAHMEGFIALEEDKMSHMANLHKKTR